MNWEAAYQQKDTPWDKGGASPGLVDFLEASPVLGRVLVPGCGLGHDVRAIAKAGAAEVVGVDIAPTALERARKHKTAGAERFVEADLFDLPGEYSGAFDWVWEHTCFCALPRAQRENYVRAVRGTLKKGGSLAAVFFLDPGLPDPDAGPPFGVTKKELDVLFIKSGAFKLIHEWEPKRWYPGREGREWMRLMRAV